MSVTGLPQRPCAPSAFPGWPGRGAAGGLADLVDRFTPSRVSIELTHHCHRLRRRTQRRACDWTAAKAMCAKRFPRVARPRRSGRLGRSGGPVHAPPRCRRSRAAPPEKSRPRPAKAPPPTACWSPGPTAPVSRSTWTGDFRVLDTEPADGDAPPRCRRSRAAPPEKSRPRPAKAPPPTACWSPGDRRQTWPHATVAALGDQVEVALG